MVMIIPYSDMEFNANHLEVKWIDNKTEDRLLIKKSVEYVQNIVPISIQKYFCGAHM